MLDKRVLKRVKRLVSRKPLDRGDRAPVVLHRQRQAGDDALSVYQHRAGPACTLVAALLCAGHVQMFAQEIEQ